MLSYYFCFADLCPNTYFANRIQIYNEEINDLLSTFKGAACPDETKSNVRSYIYTNGSVSVPYDFYTVRFCFGFSTLECVHILPNAARWL